MRFILLLFICLTANAITAQVQPHDIKKAPAANYILKSDAEGYYQPTLATEAGNVDLTEVNDAINTIDNTAVKSVNGVLPINGNVSIVLTDYSGDISILQSELQERASEINELFNELNNTNNAVTTIDNTVVKSVNGVLPVNGNVSIQLTDYSGNFSNLQNQINTINVDLVTLNDAIGVNITAIAANSQWINDYVAPAPYDDAELRSLINYNRYFVDNYTPYDDAGVKTSIANNTTAIQSSVKSVNGITPVNGNVTLPDSEVYDDTAITTAINAVDTKATANSQWINSYVPPFKFVRTNVIPIAYNSVEDDARYAYIGNGFGNKVGDHGVVCGGRNNYASDYAFTSGLDSKALKNYASAIGRGCIANGVAASAEMYLNTVNGKASKVWGWRNTLNSDYSTIVGGVDFQPRVSISEMAYVPQLSIWKDLQENTSGEYQILVRDSSAATDGMVQFINAGSLNHTEDIEQIKAINNSQEGKLTDLTADLTALNSTVSNNSNVINAGLVPYVKNDIQILNDGNYFGVKNFEQGVLQSLFTVEKDKIAFWVKPLNSDPNHPDFGRSRFQLNEEYLELQADKIFYRGESTANVIAPEINLENTDKSRVLSLNDDAIVMRIRKLDNTYDSISLSEEGCYISGKWLFYDPETLQKRDLIALVKNLEQRISQLENQ